MTVRAILESKGRDVFTIEPGAKVAAAVKLLSERRIGAVLVMLDGRLEGILSERDIVRVLGDRGASVLDEPVRAVMTTKVVTCKSADTVALWTRSPRIVSGPASASACASAIASRTPKHMP